MPKEGEHVSVGEGLDAKGWRKGVTQFLASLTSALGNRPESGIRRAHTYSSRTPPAKAIHVSPQRIPQIYLEPGRWYHLTTLLRSLVESHARSYHPPRVRARGPLDLILKRSALHVQRDALAPDRGGLQLALRRSSREPAVQHVQPRVRALLHPGHAPAGHRVVGRGAAVPRAPLP